MREGTRVDDKFEIVRELGGGGMATVYSAKQPSLDNRLVAIKVFNGGLVGDGPRRFIDEASRHARLNHPNIVSVIDSGRHEGRPYLVMNYVDGKTLAQIIIDKVYVPLPEKLKWMEQLCLAVACAHSQRIIHRDIKPSNVMVLWNTPDRPVQLLDFGIACFEGSETAVTEAGTASYMSPEQHSGEETLPQSDQFALGVVFYELLTYTQAFPGSTAAGIRRRVLGSEPTPLSQMIPGLDKDLIRIVETALRKNPVERYESVLTLANEITKVRQQLEHQVVLPPTIPPRPVDSERRVADPLQPERHVLADGEPAAASEVSRRAVDLDESNADAQVLENAIGLHLVPNELMLKARSAATSAVVWLRERLPVVQPGRLRFPERKTLVYAAVLAACLVVVGGLISVIATRWESQPHTPTLTPPPGTVVVHAVPWATITAIEDENGLKREVPQEASTPLSLNLPAGRYTVVLTGPPPALEQRRVQVRAGPEGLATVSEDFGLTVEEYFQQYFVAGEGATGASRSAGQPNPIRPPKGEAR